jgi:hypothetical protein
VVSSLQLFFLFTLQELQMTLKIERISEGQETRQGAGEPAGDFYRRRRRAPYDF